MVIVDAGDDLPVKLDKGDCYQTPFFFTEKARTPGVSWQGHFDK